MVSLQVEACEGVIAIILASRALLVKMLLHVTIKLDGIFGSFFLLMYFSIVQPLV